MRGVIVALLITASFVPFATAAAPDYPIKLHRPYARGDVYRLRAAGGIRTVTTLRVGDQPPRESVDGSETSLVGLVRVSEVDGRGTPTSLEVRVERLTDPTVAQAVDLLPPGTTIVAAWRPGGTPSFTTKEGPLPPELQLRLAQVIPLYPPGIPTDDDTHGTADRKKVGDSWELRPEARDLFLRAAGAQKVAEPPKSTVRFMEVREIGRVPAGVFQLRSSIAMPLDVRFDGMPDWSKVTENRVEGEKTLVVAVDPAGPPVSDFQLTTFIVRTSGKSPEGPTVRVDVVTTKTMNLRFERAE